MTSLPRWLSGLFSAKPMSSKQARRPAPRRRHRTLLRVEGLEDRLAPAVITVTTTADDVSTGNGAVSLREAITAINAGSTTDKDIKAQLAKNSTTFGHNDTINFAIPGAGLRTIQVGSGPTSLGALPAITRAVLINGYSQAGAQPNTLAVG